MTRIVKLITPSKVKWSVSIDIASINYWVDTVKEKTNIPTTVISDKPIVYMTKIVMTAGTLVVYFDEKEEQEEFSLSLTNLKQESGKQESGNWYDEYYSESTIAISWYSEFSKRE